MLIPIRCFTCGKVLADKYDYYLKEVQKIQKNDTNESKSAPEQKEDYKHFEAIQTGPILDKLGLNRYCCRRHMLGTVDLMDTI